MCLLCATRTVIQLLNGRDRLAIVAYSNAARCPENCSSTALCAPRLGCWGVLIAPVTKTWMAASSSASRVQFRNQPKDMPQQRPFCNQFKASTGIASVEYLIWHYRSQSQQQLLASADQESQAAKATQSKNQALHIFLLATDLRQARRSGL